MDDREKKKWIIRYIKKNNFDDILKDKYKNGRVNILKEHTNEIQSICSILSVLVIGLASLFIALQNNYYVEEQTKIMKDEQKPIISISSEIQNSSTDKLLIVNDGTSAKDYGVEIYTYLDVQCNENKMGTIPTRVYMVNTIQDMTQEDTSNIAEIILYNEESPVVVSLKNDLHEIINNYTNLYWDFSLKYLFRITSIDIMDEKNVDYFVYYRHNVNRVSEEYADDIIEEYNCMIDNHDGTQTSKETYFDLNDNDAEEIFKYILKKIRNEDLYAIDFETNKKYLYGEYEP